MKLLKFSIIYVRKDPLRGECQRKTSIVVLTWKRSMQARPKLRVIGISKKKRHKKKFKCISKIGLIWKWTNRDIHSAGWKKYVEASKKRVSILLRKKRMKNKVNKIINNINKEIKPRSKILGWDINNYNCEWWTRYY